MKTNTQPNQTAKWVHFSVPLSFPEKTQLLANRRGIIEEAGPAETLLALRRKLRNPGARMTFKSYNADHEAVRRVWFGGGKGFEIPGAISKISEEGKLEKLDMWISPGVYTETRIVPGSFSRRNEKGHTERVSTRAEWLKVGINIDGLQLFVAEDREGAKAVTEWWHMVVADRGGPVIVRPVLEYGEYTLGGPDVLHITGLGHRPSDISVPRMVHDHAARMAFKLDGSLKRGERRAALADLHSELARLDKTAKENREKWFAETRSGMAARV